MCREYLPIGVRRTQKERNRKLHTQMTNEEKVYLTNKVNKVNRLVPTRHSQEKMDMLDISLDYIAEILHTIKPNQIVEYNTGRGNESRVLVKDNRIIITDTGKKVNGKYVIDVNTGRLVTVYINKVGDKHKTIDMSLYNKDLKII